MPHTPTPHLNVDDLLATLPDERKPEPTKPEADPNNPLAALARNLSAAATTKPLRYISPSLAAARDLRLAPPAFHTTQGLGFSCCRALQTLTTEQAYKEDISVARLLRIALYEYLCHPSYRKPKVTPATIFPLRDATMALTISAKKFPELRPQLIAYAKANRLETAVVLRRATYEYLRKQPDLLPPEKDPAHQALLLDAYGRSQ